MECKWEGKEDEGEVAAVGLRSESKADGERTANIVEAVSQYFYENDDFADQFEAFVADSAHIIDLGSDENKLEYTQIYQKYQDLFEKELEGFITKQGWTVVEFYDVIRGANDKDPFSNEAIFGKILTATADFDVFMMMMREAAQAQAHKRK